MMSTHWSRWRIEWPFSQNSTSSRQLRWRKSCASSTRSCSISSKGRRNAARSPRGVSRRASLSRIPRATGHHEEYLDAMENRSYTVGAGLFVLFLIALLIGAILWYEERGHLHGVPYDLISSTSVAGLTIGATVRLRGVEIGQVRSIGFDANDPTKIRVRISVDPNYHLSKGSYATLSYQGLSGNGYIELDFPNDERGVLASSLPVPA